MREMPELEHLARYERPSSFADFADFDRTDYYVAYGQHRDSDTLARSNFRSMLRALGGESETVLVIRDSHWAVGYVENIYIHESDADRLAIADRILDRLDGYPVVDESDWSELQYEEACEYWSRITIQERIDYCVKHDVSIFAARRDYVPDDPAGELLSDLADGC
jgi:Txe/YoeB family toxin of Txe-Axe toxin-antitoxin module